MLPCGLNENTLVIQFDIYSCCEQYSAIQHNGDFTLCRITIVILPSLGILYWELLHREGTPDMLGSSVTL